jgi:flagellar motor component MotA
VIGRILFIVLLVCGVILSGKFTDFYNGPGFVFVFLGGIALALMSFSSKDIGKAFAHASGRIDAAKELHKSKYFWETAVRNFWMMGVLGSIISFVIALGSSEGGIFGIASRMSASYLSAVYGMILAVICFVPALKIKGTLNSLSKEEAHGVHEKPEDIALHYPKFENIIGYVLFIAVLGWAIFTPLLGEAFEGPLNPWDLFLYWPSILVVLGGTLAIVLFVGKAVSSQSLTLGFALTGLLATLMGFVQAMFGFASKGIQDIASAITFILSSCFIALLGMMLLGNPLEDRSIYVDRVQKSYTLNRIAWFVFPFITLILLFLTFVMVVTPIQKG